MSDIAGTTSNDTLNGRDASDTITGGRGRESVVASSGSDLVDRDDFADMSAGFPAGCAGRGHEALLQNKRLQTMPKTHHLDLTFMSIVRQTYANHGTDRMFGASTKEVI